MKPSSDKEWKLHLQEWVELEFKGLIHVGVERDRRRLTAVAFRGGGPGGAKHAPPAAVVRNREGMKALTGSTVAIQEKLVQVV